MLVGYMRVSTEEQILASQRAELEKAGCERIFEDQASGRLAERPGLEAALDYCRPGDTLVVTRLDRLGRSLKNLLELSARMEGMKIELHSLKESIDTSTSAGRLFFHMMASLAEFQADLIRERTRAGLAEARKRGQLGGSKPKLTPERFALAKQLYDAQQCTVGDIAKEFGISRATFYNYLTRAKAKAMPTEAPAAQPAKAPAMATAPKPDPARLYLERRAAFAQAAKEARSKSAPLNVAAHLGAAEGDQNERQ